MITRYVLPLLAVALLIFAMVQVIGAQKAPEKAVPPIQPPRSPFPKTVAGAGMVEAQTENIAIGSPVPGVAVSVSAKVGEKVQPGTELFRLDDRQFKAELAFRAASLAAAQADLTRLENQPRKEQLWINKAQVDEAQANLEDQRDQLERTRVLITRKAATDQDLVARLKGYQMAQAQLARHQAEYEMQKNGAWEYDKQVAQAAVTQAEAQVEQTQTELDRLVVRSLVTGEVLQVNVRPGEFVAAPHNQALVVLGNVQELHVRVDIDEYDIPRFHSGAPARAMIKGWPQEEFRLKFVRVEPYVIPKRSLTGDNTERVDTRVLQVIYALEAGNKPLYVGQQLDVFIDADESAGAAPVEKSD